MTRHQDRLIKLIREHDCTAFPDGEDSLTVIGWVGKDGLFYQEQETIPATLAAVRLWLGY